MRKLNETREFITKKIVYREATRNFTGESNVFPKHVNGSFKLKELHEKIIHSGNATIVILDDGSKGVAKCMDEDRYDELKGIKIAYIRAKIKSLEKELKELCK